MRLAGGQARFLLMVAAGWIALRLAMVLFVPLATAPVAPSGPPARMVVPPRSPSRVAAGVAVPRPLRSTTRPAQPLGVPQRTAFASPLSLRPPSARIKSHPVSSSVGGHQDRYAQASTPRSPAALPALAGIDIASAATLPELATATATATASPVPPPADRLAVSTVPATRAAPADARWTGNAYLFVRPGSGPPSLAAGGELGGSQVAARLAVRLTDGPVRVAAAARLYAPLGQRGAEAAVGLDWRPVPDLPVRISIERRVRLDAAGRDAWSAYAAGGFYREALGGRVAVDGYGQAGIVGTHSRDLFADAALRAGRRWRVGQLTLVAGAGLWAAAQPRTERLDAGPRVAATLPVGTHAVTVAAEARLRLAGRAQPGSGAALTLAADF